MRNSKRKYYRKFQNGGLNRSDSLAVYNLQAKMNTLANRYNDDHEKFTRVAPQLAHGENPGQLERTYHGVPNHNRNIEKQYLDKLDWSMGREKLKNILGYYPDNYTQYHWPVDHRDRDYPGSSRFPEDRNNASGLPLFNRRYKPKGKENPDDPFRKIWNEDPEVRTKYPDFETFKQEALKYNEKKKDKKSPEKITPSPIKKEIEALKLTPIETEEIKLPEYKPEIKLEESKPYKPKKRKEPPTNLEKIKNFLGRIKMPNRKRRYGRKPKTKRVRNLVTGKYNYTYRKTGTSKRRRRQTGGYYEDGMIYLDPNMNISKQVPSEDSSIEDQKSAEKNRHRLIQQTPNIQEGLELGLYNNEDEVVIDAIRRETNKQIVMQDLNLDLADLDLDDPDILEYFNIDEGHARFLKTKQKSKEAVKGDPANKYLFKPIHDFGMWMGQGTVDMISSPEGLAFGILGGAILGKTITGARNLAKRYKFKYPTNPSHTSGPRGTVVNSQGQIQTSFSNKLKSERRIETRRDNTQVGMTEAQGTVNLGGTKFRVIYKAADDGAMMVDLHAGAEGSMTLKLPKGNTNIYHLDMKMGNPRDVKRAVDALEEFLPKGSIIQSSEYSIDSYRFLTNQIAKGKMTYVSTGERTGLSTLGKQHERAGLSNAWTEEHALKAVKDVNKMLDKAGIKERAKLITDLHVGKNEQVHFIYKVEVPHIQGKLTYKKGGFKKQTGGEWMIDEETGKRVTVDLGQVHVKDKKPGVKAWLKRNYKKYISPIGHGVLDAVGVVPGLGEPFDLANAAWYGLEGNYKDAAISTAAAVPIWGWGATGAKYAAKGAKAIAKGTSKKVFDIVPQSYYKGPRYHKGLGIEGLNTQVQGITAQGKWLDDMGYDAATLLKGENIKYIGDPTKSGRVVVEVALPNGQTQLFYKSSGGGKKAGRGVGGTTEGAWQPFGGYSDQVPTGWEKNKAGDWVATDVTKHSTDDWHIKSPGYEDFYGSKSYEDIASQLDRISYEQGWDMSPQKYMSKGDFNKKQKGGVYDVRLGKPSESEQKSRYISQIKGSRKGTRLNFTDIPTSVSSHLMVWGECGSGYCVYPTLFQDDNGNWYEKRGKAAFEEAKRKGEVYEFNTAKEAAEWAGPEAPWKTEKSGPGYKMGGYKKYIRKYQSGGTATGEPEISTKDRDAARREWIEGIISESIERSKAGTYEDRLKLHEISLDYFKSLRPSTHILIQEEYGWFDSDDPQLNAKIDELNEEAGFQRYSSSQGRCIERNENGHCIKSKQQIGIMRHKKGDKRFMVDGAPRNKDLEWALNNGYIPNLDNPNWRREKDYKETGVLPHIASRQDKIDITSDALYQSGVGMRNSMEYIYAAYNHPAYEENPEFRKRVNEQYDKMMKGRYPNIEVDEYGVPVNMSHDDFMRQTNIFIPDEEGIAYTHPVYAQYPGAEDWPRDEMTNIFPTFQGSNIYPYGSLEQGYIPTYPKPQPDPEPEPEPEIIKEKEKTMEIPIDTSPLVEKEQFPGLSTLPITADPITSIPIEDVQPELITVKEKSKRPGKRNYGAGQKGKKRRNTRGKGWKTRNLVTGKMNRSLGTYGHYRKQRRGFTLNPFVVRGKATTRKGKRKKRFLGVFEEGGVKV